MANHRFITSFGAPYFSLACLNLGDQSVLPAFGLVQVTATFRVTALPAQVSSPDELHPFFSFSHDTQTLAPIFELGVTPNGRVRANCLTGSFAQTSVGVIQSASQWHSVNVSYDGGTGSWNLILDGYAPVTPTDGAPQFLVPVAGHGSQLLFMNGGSALARTAIDLQSASVIFEGASGTAELDYTFSDRSGATTTPVITTTLSTTFPSSGVVTAHYYDPVTTSPWGAVPADPPEGQYRRGLETDWTTLVPPTTAWTQVAE